MTVKEKKMTNVQALKNRLYELVMEERAKNPALAFEPAADYIKKKILVNPMERPRGVVTGQTFKIPQRILPEDDDEASDSRTFAPSVTPSNGIEDRV